MNKKSVLNSIEVKSPCNESWDEMFGNDEVRFCSHCAKDVHNLSAMTRQKAEKLLKSNKSLCVRYIKNTQGEIVTAPPKFTQITRRATIAAGVLASSLVLTTMTYAQAAPEPVQTKRTSTQTSKEKPSKTEQNQQLSMFSGKVQDSEGAVIPKAKVTLKNTKTEKVFFTQTNNDGFYQFLNIEPSVYELTIESFGFNKSVYRNIGISEGMKLEKNLNLVGELTIGVVTIADPPMIEIEDVKLTEKII